MNTFNPSLCDYFTWTGGSVYHDNTVRLSQALGLLFPTIASNAYCSLADFPVLTSAPKHIESSRYPTGALLKVQIINPTKEEALIVT
jgi:hypothetical protein